jgi:hypothetical protein
VAKNKWICEKCGKQYTTQQEAEKCESSHERFEADKAVVKSVMFYPGDTFPSTITVAFDEGKSQTYYQRK